MSCTSATGWAQGRIQRKRAAPFRARGTEPLGAGRGALRGPPPWGRMAQGLWLKAVQAQGRKDLGGPAASPGSAAYQLGGLGQIFTLFVSPCMTWGDGGTAPIWLL